MTKMKVKILETMKKFQPVKAHHHYLSQRASVLHHQSQAASHPRLFSRKKTHSLQFQLRPIHPTHQPNRLRSLYPVHQPLTLKPRLCQRAVYREALYPIPLYLSSLPLPHLSSHPPIRGSLLHRSQSCLTNSH
jgi:hypothetical protein